DYRDRHTHGTASGCVVQTKQKHTQKDRYNEPFQRGILKLDGSCISDPKSEIAHWTSRQRQSNVRFRISDLRSRIRPISNSPWPSSTEAQRPSTLRPLY